MPEGKRLVVIVEYHLDDLNPDAAAQLGALVRGRLLDGRIEGATFVAAWAAVGETAYRVVELLPPRT